MKKRPKISLFSPLQVHHLEAYFQVKTRTAQKKRKEIAEYLGRESGILFFWDLAEYDNHDTDEERAVFMKKMAKLLDCEIESVAQPV